MRFTSGVAVIAVVMLVGGGVGVASGAVSRSANAQPGQPCTTEGSQPGPGDALTCTRDASGALV